jgi:hypothetical protein
MFIKERKCMNYMKFKKTLQNEKKGAYLHTKNNNKRNGLKELIS